MADGYLVSPLDGVSLRLCVPESDEPSVRAVRSGQYPPTLQWLLAVLRSSVDPRARVFDLGGYLGGREPRVIQEVARSSGLIPPPRSCRVRC